MKYEEGFKLTPSHSPGKPTRKTSSLIKVKKASKNY